MNPKQRPKMQRDKNAKRHMQGVKQAEDNTIKEHSQTEAFKYTQELMRDSGNITVATKGQVGLDISGNAVL